MTDNNNHNTHSTRGTRPLEGPLTGPSASGSEPTTLLEIGILTLGKPTLSMALSSLLLQDEQRVRIHIVDTAPSPIINRPEVQSVLRLAAWIRQQT